MQKDFDGWNAQKKQLDARHSAPFCHERELWWCALGVNVGSEQDGSGAGRSRPVLVLKHLSRDTFLAVPLTTSSRGHPLRVAVGMVDGKAAQALLSQLRVVDTRRLVRKIGSLDKQMFGRIRNAVKDVL